MIAARGMPTAMPTLALIDKLGEELSEVDNVGVVLDEKLGVVIGEELGVVIGKELDMLTDDGKSQPFTWIPTTVAVVCTMEPVVDQVPDMPVANLKTSPGVRFETHSPGLGAA